MTLTEALKLLSSDEDYDSNEVAKAIKENTLKDSSFLSVSEEKMKMLFNRVKIDIPIILAFVNGVLTEDTKVIVYTLLEVCIVNSLGALNEMIDLGWDLTDKAMNGDSYIDVLLGMDQNHLELFGESMVGSYDAFMDKVSSMSDK